jgi:hypothetical protein
MVALWTNANVSSVVGVVQAGIAVMVTSSTVLRPLFDVTIVRWFNLESLKQSSGGNNVSLVTWGHSGETHPAVSGTGTKASVRRRDQRLRQLSESEENLRETDFETFQKSNEGHITEHNSEDNGAR